MRGGEQGRIECVLTLENPRIAAIVYGPNCWGTAVLWLNRRVAHGRRPINLLLWARRELASGKRVSWLLADELDDLA